jgi:hypothetical protein
LVFYKDISIRFVRLRDKVLSVYSGFFHPPDWVFPSPKMGNT